MTEDIKTPQPPASATPTASGRRYLAQLMEHAFREGWRTPDDFVRYFPAHSIMAALKSATELRVAILAAATGIYEEILRRKTPALAAEDLRLALEEGTTSSQQLLSVFTPEDRVRYLDPHRIWDFLAEDHFWHVEGDAGEEQRRGAADRMTFTLTQAVQERLISLRDILDGVTYDAVADSLSPHELRAVVRFALVKGREGIGLNEKVLLEVLPLEKLVRSVPLEHIWREVVIRRLAVPCGFSDLSREEQRASQVERRPPSAPEQRPRWSQPPPPPMGLPGDSSRSPRSSDFGRSTPNEYPRAVKPNDQLVTALPPAPLHDLPGAARMQFGDDDPFSLEDDERTGLSPRIPEGVGGLGRENSLLPPPPRTFQPSEPGAAGPGMTDDFNRPLPPEPPSSPGSQPPSSLARSGAPAFDAAAADASERQRQRVTEHLRAIGRLPPNHQSLPAGVLRSIDAMYALLPSATDDIQRRSVIRQAFANENHLRAALLGLIELMDSSVDTSDPVIQGAKIEALIKILLFEEQRRKETGRFPTSSYGPPARTPAPPSGAGMPGSAPPGSFAPPGGSSDAYSEGNEGFYYPAPAPSGRVITQRPPPPVLAPMPGYSTPAPPLPNLPAEPASSRRRTVPPPLPPSYPRE
jgi:hypothetical protein